MKSIIDEIRSEFANGKSQHEIIDLMNTRGMPIIDAIKVVRELFPLGLGDAKRLVATHPAYQEIAAASEPLHDEAIRAFREEAT